MAMSDRDDNVEMFTIYFNPTDYPNRYVVRRFVIFPNMADPVADPTPTRICHSIQEARRAIPDGLVMMTRHPSDPLGVVESWV